MMPKKAPNSIDISVGSRIRLRRTLMGMSQEQLADQLGVTFQQVQKYEKGTNRVSASRLSAVAQVLDVPIRYFFAEKLTTGASDERVPNATIVDVASAFLSRDGVELNRAFIKIRNVETRRCIIHLAKALAAVEEAEQASEAPSRGTIAH